MGVSLRERESDSDTETECIPCIGQLLIAMWCLRDAAPERCMMGRGKREEREHARHFLQAARHITLVILGSLNGIMAIRTSSSVAASPSEPMAFEDELTVGDLLSFVWRVPLIFVQWPLNYATMRLSGRPVASLHRRQRLVLSLMQSLRTCLSSRQMLILAQGMPTGFCIRHFCDKNVLVYDLVQVPVPGGEFPPAVLHFVKLAQQQQPSEVDSLDGHRRRRHRILLYCHGGGYRNRLITNAHIPLAMDMAAASRSDSVVFLEYSFTTHQRYPCQLVQAIAGLQYLMTEKGVPSEDIILAGDSAGAHLVLGLLAHAVSPGPFSPALKFDNGNNEEREQRDDSDRNSKQASFAAAVLISPWVTMTGDEVSMRDNKRDDYMDREHLIELVDSLQPTIGDVWCDLWKAPNAQAVWDKVFSSKRDAGTAAARPLCKKALFTIGTSEILLDSCLDFGIRFAKCESVSITTEKDIQLVERGKGQHVAPAVMAVIAGEAHVQAGLDNVVKYKGLGMRAVMRFLESL